MRTDVSFYYWKSNYRLNSAEKETLQENACGRLYIKYFDIVKEGSIKPVSLVRFTEKPFLAVVPVIFIKNAVFQNILAAELDSLVSRTGKLLEEINVAGGVSASEVQMDCDWTETTRDAYFRFLEKFSATVRLPLSATIRLHQVKYRERTGVPPVKKGVLMFYNIGRISADTSNSIYDKRLAKKYVSYLKNYPLTLSVALPVFSWGIQQRAGKVVQLLNKANESGFFGDNAFIPLSKFIFKVKNNCFKGGYYFMEGDEIKIESVNGDQLMEIAGDLEENLKQQPAEIIFYDLDSSNTKRYEKTIFKQIRDRFY